MHILYIFIGELIPKRYLKGNRDRPKHKILPGRIIEPFIFFSKFESFSRGLLKNTKTKSMINHYTSIDSIEELYIVKQPKHLATKYFNLKPFIILRLETAILKYPQALSSRTLAGSGNIHSNLIKFLKLDPNK